MPVYALSPIDVGSLTESPEVPPLNFAYFLYVYVDGVLVDSGYPADPPFGEGFYFSAQENSTIRLVLTNENSSDPPLSAVCFLDAIWLIGENGSRKLTDGVTAATYPFGATVFDQTFTLDLGMPLRYLEVDKIRRDLAVEWPNPFGDSYCLVCDILSGLWKLVKKSDLPGSLGYGWTLAGQNISVAEDPNPDPAYPDMVLQDGSGSFDRWKKDSVTGNYSPRYANNFDTLVKDTVTGLVSITKKDKTVMNFNAAGKLATLVDRNGNTTTYTYSSGRLSSISDGEGRSFTYVYSGPSTDGRIDDGQPYQVLTQDPGRMVTFQYHPSGRLHKMVNAMGEATTMDYYPDGSLHKKTDARGKVEVEYTYGGDGRVATETRYGERRFTYTYNGSSLSVKDEDLTLANPAADARTSVYNYNDRFRLTSMVDPIGNQFFWEYNDPNNPYLMTKSVDPNQATTDFAYDALGNLTSVTNAQNRVTTMTYEQGYLLKTVQRPAVTVQGNLVTYPPTTLGYDMAGNLTSITSVLNGVAHSTTITPGPDGRPLSVTDRLGKTTQFTYTTQGSTQNKGNVQTITLPGDASKSDPARTLTFAYDRSDNRTGVLDAGGNPTTYDFDLVSRLTKITDAFSKSVDYEFVNGLLDAVEMPAVRDTNNSGLRRRTEFLPDDAGRILQVLSQKSGALGDKEMRVRHEYDGRSNLKKLTRLKSLVEKPAYEFSYDALDRPVQQKNPLGDISILTHDPFCKKYQVSSARGVVTQVNRDSLCRVTEIANPDEVRTLVYDELDRLTKVAQTQSPGGRYVNPLDLPDGPPSTYHHARFAGATTTETTEFLYDEWDRLVMVTYPGNKTVSYQYDLEGRVTQLTDVLGNVTQYSYYDDGKLYQVTVVASPANQVFTYSYDAAGRVREIVYPTSSKVVAQFYNGATSGWDANGRLTTLRYLFNGAPLQSFAYTYDDSGNRKSMVETTGVSAPVTWDYTYDWLNRLDSVKQDGILKSVYVYDESDNRIELQMPGQSQTHSYTFDFADRILTRSVNGSLVESFNHDKDGNMTDRTLAGVTTKYQWDSSNKLTSIQKGAFQEKYLYDSGGVRKSRGSDTRYFSSGSASLSDLRPTNSISFIQGDQIRGMRYGGAFYWYISDALGTVRSVVDTSGVVVGSYASDEFGRETAVSGTVERPHTYTGALGVRNEWGSDSQLLYARQRWYDPQLGRWLSADPIGFAGGLNLYGYVGQNPIMRTDPSGLIGPFIVLVEAWELAQIAEAGGGLVAAAETIETVGVVTETVAPAGFSAWSLFPSWTLPTTGSVFGGGSYYFYRTGIPTRNVILNPRDFGVGGPPAPCRWPSGRTSNIGPYRYNRIAHYGRTPSRAQRRLRGVGPNEVLDHNPPLGQRFLFGDPAINEPPGYMMTPKERAASASDMNRMEPQPRFESNIQGGQMRAQMQQWYRDLGI